MGRKVKPRIAWTHEQASYEFNIDRKTLSGRLRQAGIDPGADGKFTTVQIVRAIYSDLESERIRKTRAEADQVEMENAEKAGKLIDAEDWSRRWAPMFASITRLIRTSELTDDKKDSVLNELGKILK